MKNNGNVVGIIFPLLHEHIDRFFDAHKTVFVKFYGKEYVPSRLRPGSKLYFYRSGGTREIIGEAGIIEVSFGTPDEVLSKFANSLFLTQNELERYVGERKNVRMLVLVLHEPTRYSKPLVMRHPLTMAGQYMTRHMLGDLKN